MCAKLLEIKKQLWARIDAPPGETGKWLRTVVRGYFQYHGCRETGACSRAFAGRWPGTGGVRCGGAARNAG